jgi:ATP-dependent Clp protease adaptor protein ClpS
MSTSQAETVTTEAPPPAATRPAANPKRRTNPKPQPPYAVIIENDEEHTFEYVMDVLRKTFGYDEAKAFKLTFEAHTNGRAAVWSGALEVAELKRDQVRGYGPDFYKDEPVTFPLGCTVEPLAG